MKYQLGAGFRDNTLLREIRKIFSVKNIEQDERVERLLSFKEELSFQEEKGLKEDYFSEYTGTAMDDQDNKDMFWDMLLKFVRLQKQVSNGSTKLLANAILPDKDGAFETEASNNFSYFCFQFTKTLENKYIEERIAQLKLKLSETEYNKLVDDYKKGNVILVRKQGPGAPFGIFTKDQIEYAQGSEPYRRRLMSGLFTEVGVKGEVGFVMNPSTAPQEAGQEYGSTLQEMLKSIWENKLFEMQKILKKAGMVMIEKGTIDNTGTITIHVKRGGVKLKIQVSVAKDAKFKDRKLHFTFDDKTKRHFTLSGGEVNDYFGKQNLSAAKAHRRYVEAKEARTAGAFPPSGRLVAARRPGGPGAMPKKGAKGLGVGAPLASKPKPVEKAPAAPMPQFAPPAAPQGAGTVVEEGEGEEAGGTRVVGVSAAGLKGQGVMGSKQEYKQRMADRKPKLPKTPTRGGKGLVRRLLPGRKKKKSKSGSMTALRITGIVTSGVSVLSAIGAALS